MKGSAVQAFRSIVSKIHPQIALSPKESQRLLQALTTSFRHQLDQAHPQSRSLDHERLPTEPTRQSYISAGKSGTKPHSSPTDLHLASVLTNPLLANPSGRDTIAAQRAVDKHQKHPIKVFEEHASRGVATLETARLCLAAFRRSLSSLPETEALAQIRRYNAGARVLRWAWSTAQEASDIFAHGPKLVTDLSHFLVAEGREGVIWEWMDTMKGRVTISLPGKKLVTSDPRALLLRSILNAHMSFRIGGDSESALRTFLRALQHFTSISRGSESALPDLLRSAGTYLTRELLAPSTVHPTTPQYAILYNKYIGACQVWEKAFDGGSISYRVASLELQHPLKPSPLSALEYIRYLSRMPHLRPFEKWTPQEKSPLTQLCFDAANVLQSQGFHDDASWVVEFMARHLGAHLLEDEVLMETLQRPQQKSTAVTGEVSQDVWGSLDWKAPVPG